MIRPLNLEKLGSLPSSLPFGFTKNTDRMLTVRQIRLEVEDLMINSPDRILEATTELRHVEHVMNPGKTIWQLQLIR